MKCCIVRKVPYRLPGTNRLVWGVILAEREGLSLMFVQKPDDHRSHMLTVATENVPERVFVESRATCFHLEPQDMAEIGSKLQSLGEGLSSDEFMKLFNTDDLW